MIYLLAFVSGCVLFLAWEAIATLTKVLECEKEDLEH